MNTMKPRHNYWLFFAIVALILMFGCSSQQTYFEKHPPRYMRGCKVCGKQTCDGIHVKR